jgi:uncharacterized membrane protein (UPF0127 family)
MSRGAVMAAAFALACPSRPPPPAPASVEAPAAVAARAHLHTRAGVATVSVEVARTPASRERGLMDRPELAPDAGMLFVFDAAAPHAFWMKNTLIPLDMIFLADDGRVLAVVERKPLTLDTTDGGVSSRYVLEVNGGWARAHGVARGDQVTLENVLW